MIKHVTLHWYSLLWLMKINEVRHGGAHFNSLTTVIDLPPYSVLCSVTFFITRDIRLKVEIVFNCIVMIELWNLYRIFDGYFCISLNTKFSKGWGTCWSGQVNTTSYLSHFPTEQASQMKSLSMIVVHLGVKQELQHLIIKMSISTWCCC